MKDPILFTIPALRVELALFDWGLGRYEGDARRGLHTSLAIGPFWAIKEEHA